AGIADEAAAGLYDGLRNGIAEVPAQRAEDRLAVGFELRGLAYIAGREAAAEIDHGEVDAALGAAAEDRGRGRERSVPGLDVVLLRADVERNAVGDEPVPVGELQDVGGELGLAAELARERPFRAGAIAMDAADHAAAGRGARNLLDLGLAVDRVERHAERAGGGNVALLLDRV